MKFVLISLFLLTNVITAQTDWHRWKAPDFSYRKELPHSFSFKVDDSSVGIEVVSFFQNAYYLLFSNYDGDNCPFKPTCSHFFVKAVKATNILQGALMFADRFTRDTNLFKTKSEYPVNLNGRLFDPIYLYLFTVNPFEIEKYFAGGN